MGDPTEARPTTAGLLTQFSPDEIDAMRRRWDGTPGRTAPLANIALAVELAAGLDEVREFPFQGQSYRMRPTPYHVGVRLLAWKHQLDRATAGTPAEAAARLTTAGALLDLRACCHEIATLGGLLLEAPVSPNPFEHSAPMDYQRLVAFALDSGDDLRRDPEEEDGDQEVQPYDARHYLFAYLAHFGSVPGMVVLERGRPAPATWRHFMSALAYLRRAHAEAELVAFSRTASAQHGGEAATTWLEAIQEDAGRVL